MISIINYGVGNIKAIQNVYLKLNISVNVISRSDELNNTQKIILPGVGSFDYAMTLFNQSGMREKITELVLEKGIPVIGICVGMQMLANSSEEGILPGLGWVDATVRKFNVTSINGTLPIPHMGWNDVYPKNNNPLFEGLQNEARFYFLHSYYLKCNEENQVLAKAKYTEEFVCGIYHSNIYGVQFHPEKSHHFGVKLLENFAKL